MNRIAVQIYEIQTPFEAQALIEMGVDHIGSVIVSEESWKQPLIKETIELSKNSNAQSSLIPLLNKLSSILKTLDYYQPEIVHFCEALTNSDDTFQFSKELIHIQENVRKRFPDIKIMRSIPILPLHIEKGMINPVPSLKLAHLFEPVSDYFLTDTLLVEKKSGSCEKQPVKGFVGLTGRTCDWDIAAKLVQSSRIPVILAGGISVDNVYEGIMRVRPAGVDSCTLTNSLDAQGRPIRFKKDFDRVKRFVDEARKAERMIAIKSCSLKDKEGYTDV
ncbi:MAG: hypothetical protein JW786_00695 [Desulfobacterales bacterium]|nr:hypothetical protein [Desulfobacterales bacterium]